MASEDEEMVVDPVEEEEKEGGEESEGEGINLGVNEQQGGFQDSSEEEEDDADEARRIAKGDYDLGRELYSNLLIPDG
jgi:hypothetical protein